MKTKDAVKKTDPNIQERLKLERNLQKIKRQLSTEKQIRKELETENHRLQIVADIRAELKDLSPLAFQVKPISKGTEATAVAQFSDWHVEETVDPKTINGVNKYNLNIASKSMETFFQKLVSLVEHERAITPIPNLVLHLGGDLLSGYIHEELQENNQLSPIDAIIWLMEHMTAGLDYLYEHGKFKEIKVVCSCGNHGRTTKKIRHATEVNNSYEYLLYHFLAGHYKRKKKLTFLIGDGYHTWVNIYKFPCRFHHGHGIRYAGGVGGITIPVNKAIAQWDKIKPAYLDFFGHYHQRIVTRKFCSNGCGIGYNAFALFIKAEPEPPQQNLVIIDRDRGKTKDIPIFVRG